MVSLHGFATPAPLSPPQEPEVLLYGLLDDFNEVIRWIDYKPSDEYRYITKRVPKVKKQCPINWNNFEAALI